MSIVIIGVLFAIAIGAAIALVFIVRSEPNEERAQPEHITGTAPVAAVTPAASEEAEESPALNLPPVLEEEVSEIVFHPQTYELSHELQTIRQQMQQLEQRLNVVTIALEQAQHAQNGHFSTPVDHTPVPETPPHP